MANNAITKIDQIALYSRLIVKTVRMSLGMTRNLPTVISTLGPMLKKKQSDPRYGHPADCRRVDGKLYWHMHIPGFPSPAFDRVFRHWLAHNLGLLPYPGLYSGHVAITRTCSLNCEHCFEWEPTNQPETRSEEDIMKTVEQLINLGAAQIILSGGEPVSRFPLLLRIVGEFCTRGVQFWIITSGTGLTRDRIEMLKKSGLTGIIFSLDHHDMHAHDRFRRQSGCYQQVISSVKTSHALGLVTAFALCATNEFVCKDNLEAYMQLASDLNLTFIQILEPKPIGKYEGQDVSLKPDKRKLLESFFDRASIASSESRGSPLIMYPDYHNRRYGCEGGKFHLYIDTKGQAFPCPFCKSTTASMRELTPSNLGKKLFCPNAAEFGV
jgi:MoaA/NifB/PqqE/SkfB family radical SAM enzyme